MTHQLKRAACAVVFAALMAACDEAAITSPTVPPDIPGRVLLALSADSAAELEALAADASDRIAPAVPNVEPAISVHIHQIASGLSAHDDARARQGLDAARRALGEAEHASNDPDVAALRLDLEALHRALEDAPSRR